MKRIFLICSLFVAACTAVFAQSAPSHPAPTPVSKTEFMAKVSELNALISAENATAAEAKFHEISQLANNEMTILRYKMQDAMDAHNDAEKQHYMEMSKTQRTLFAEALQMKSNMSANKAAINQKLTTFANGII